MAEKIKLSELCEDIDYGTRVVFDIDHGKIRCAPKQIIKRKAKIKGTAKSYEIEEDLQIEHD